MSLISKHIILGVTGGIAAYKSAELVRLLKKSGAQVRVVMTKSATEFVTPLTFQALSGNPVHTELLDTDAEAAMGHIELARWADAVMIAPTSADFLSRLAHGSANDLLSTLCLATEAPILLAPAMNRAMWANQATQDNCEILATRGIHMLGPASGEQACGETGEGRMLEPDELLSAVEQQFMSGSLNGLRVIITAGPTREPIDPVRYISNRSSGRMGYALTQAAIEAGAEVTLISGPTNLQPPERAKVMHVLTAEDMHSAVMNLVKTCDIFIGCAAVADYRPAFSAAEKIKKSTSDLALTLIPNADILHDVAQMKPAPFTLGFAAETNALEEHALQKLNRKGVDMIAANDVSNSAHGFDSQTNALEVYWQGGHCSFPSQTKDQLARNLLELLAKRYNQTKNTPNIIASLNNAKDRSQNP